MQTMLDLIHTSEKPLFFFNYLYAGTYTEPMFPILDISNHAWMWDKYFLILHFYQALSPEVNKAYTCSRW